MNRKILTAHNRSFLHFLKYHSFGVHDGGWMLKFCDLLPGDMIQDPNLLIVAANGQELTAGAPGDRLYAKRPLIRTVGGQQATVQRI